MAQAPHSTVCTHLGYTTEPKFFGDSDLDYEVRKQKIILISCRLGFYRREFMKIYVAS